MTAILEVDGVTVAYKGAITAAVDVGLTVETGTSVAIIGANGAGKSSIMKTLAGWHGAASGRIVFDGRDITGDGPTERARAGLTYSPEGGHIYRRLTVRENLLMGGYLAKAGETQFEAACAPFPVLLERLDQLAGTLSGGERQMLALARAMMFRPRLLLIDEMSIGLMPKALDVVFRAVVELVEKGVSVLLTEQNARKAMATVDYVYLLENGRIVLSGKPDEIARDPRVVAVYLGG
jgi:branched-chain amino acid transport system ATP-binding protein